MDPTSAPINPAELYELLGIVGGVIVSGLLGFVLVRRARASRQRMIDAVGEAPAPRFPEKKKKPALEAAEEEEEPEEQAEEQAEQPAAEEEPAPSPAARKPAARAREAEQPPVPEPERAPAQVIPFPAPAPARKGAALLPGLQRTRGGFIARLGEIFAGKKQIDPSVVDEIEKVLLTADIGVRTSQKLLEEIRSSLSRRELADPDAVWAFLRRRATEMLSLPAPPVDFASARPFVLLIIGVNGSGKTTTIGKLAARLAADGKKVLLAAGDTFRAAAVEQLDVWAKRTSTTLVRGKENADPSSVIFDGVKRAATESFDVAICDTAGRLHTKTDLMQELQKVRRTVGKASAGAPHETWLVIDATSGQNAIAQAQIFTEAMAVSGIVLTKLDGTAKGGVILGIADQLKIPVRYIGVGEKVEDLRPFDPDEFVDALFEPAEHSNEGAAS
ncbi:MAG TPA: signal recognition particle-docking protein FtsY [Polyangia bacterium]|jgi:fused signal recognition particle receptor|nr:signal recognition particle-docking protein FtsY [Polyangia bacterium]